MNALDTNIFIYRLDHSDPRKHVAARDLIRALAKQGDTVLPWQVAGEFLRQLSRWRNEGRLSFAQIQRVSAAIRQMFPLAMPTDRSLDLALHYAETYNLSHWDSMLVAACAETGVTTLYTEDMGSPRTIDKIQLMNPF